MLGSCTEVVRKKNFLIQAEPPLVHAEKIGLGTAAYELEEISL